MHMQPQWPHQPLSLGWWKRRSPPRFLYITGIYPTAPQYEKLLDDESDANEDDGDEVEDSNNGEDKESINHIDTNHES